MPTYRERNDMLIVDLFALTANEYMYAGSVTGSDNTCALFAKYKCFEHGLKFYPDTVVTGAPYTAIHVFSPATLFYAVKRNRNTAMSFCCARQQFPFTMPDVDTAGKYAQQYYPDYAKTQVLAEDAAEIRYTSSGIMFSFPRIYGTVYWNGTAHFSVSGSFPGITTELPREIAVPANVTLHKLMQNIQLVGALRVEKEDGTKIYHETNVSGTMARVIGNMFHVFMLPDMLAPLPVTVYTADERFNAWYTYCPPFTLFPFAYTVYDNQKKQVYTGFLTKNAVPVVYSVDSVDRIADYLADWVSEDTTQPLTTENPGFVVHLQENE